MRANEMRLFSSCVYETLTENGFQCLFELLLETESVFLSRLEILIPVVALLLLPARTHSQTKIAVTVPAKSAATHSKAQSVGGTGCTRSLEGSAVPEPKNLWSENGVLRVDLAFRSSVDSEGVVRYCYVLPDGSESPNLRVHPGDTLILNFKNESNVASKGATQSRPLTRSRFEQLRNQRHHVSRHDEPALSWPSRSAGLSSRRIAENADSTERASIRIQD